MLISLKIIRSATAVSSEIRYAVYFSLNSNNLHAGANENWTQ
jgi:hypothetical protein